MASTPEVTVAVVLCGLLWLGGSQAVSEEKKSAAPTSIQVSISSFPEVTYKGSSVDDQEILVRNMPTNHRAPISFHLGSGGVAQCVGLATQPWAALRRLLRFFAKFVSARKLAMGTG